VHKVRKELKEHQVQPKVRPEIKEHKDPLVLKEVRVVFKDLLVRKGLKVQEEFLEHHLQLKVLLEPQELLDQLKVQQVPLVFLKERKVLPEHRVFKGLKGFKVLLVQQVLKEHKEVKPKERKGHLVCKVLREPRAQRDHHQTTDSKQTSKN
jgi:hypothetical protein